VDFRPYKENFSEQRQAQIQVTLDTLKNEQEEKKAVAPEDVINLGGGDLHMKEVHHINNDKNNPEIVLNQGQIEQIEKEVTRKLKKERTFEAGMKQVRERAPFHL
jgi:hypothetical protein